MQLDAFNAFKSFLGVIWQLFTGWNLPFTQMSPAQFIFLGLVLRATIKILNGVLSTSPIGVGRASDDLKAVASRNRSSYNSGTWVNGEKIG